jgi:hypothetical protein
MKMSHLFAGLIGCCTTLAMLAPSPIGIAIVALSVAQFAFHLHMEK